MFQQTCVFVSTQCAKKSVKPYTNLQMKRSILPKQTGCAILEDSNVLVTHDLIEKTQNLQ